MILIADSGSTKADWHYCRGEEEDTLVTSIGINPNLHSAAEMTTVIETACPEHIAPGKIEGVYYYGTGVWDSRRANQLKTIIEACYPNAEVEIHHDLLGAARAICGDEAGIACILGTGSNSCYYDGVDVKDNVTNLGWLLGDEGSGVDLGKRLIRAYSYRELPAEICEHFEEATGHNKSSIGDGLYGPASANRFLAGFSPFIHDNLERPEIKQLVVEAFESFLKCHVLKYEKAKDVPVGFVGSIAHHYADVLREVCAAKGLTCGSISKKPIMALVDYHRAHHDTPTA